MSAYEWEEFVDEWITIKKNEYLKTEKLGGAGDLGRDVVGFVDEPAGNINYIWDNYQCKYYKDALTPSPVWVEMAKVIYYAFTKEYPLPRKYYFIAPKGVGTKLSDLLRKPEKLRDELIKHWGSHCKEQITGKNEIELSDELLNYINELDFTIFDKKTPRELIEEHSATKYHVERFGAELPDRPDASPVPESIQPTETRYVQQLLKAYSNHCGDVIEDVKKLDTFDTYKKHLKRSREEFNQAESLRNFSRDTVPNGTYDNLKNEIYNGVVDQVEDEHPDGFSRVKKVVSEARKLIITNNPLVVRMNVQDRGGVCHQLANEDKIKWLPDDDK